MKGNYLLKQQGICEILMRHNKFLGYLTKERFIKIYYLGFVIRSIKTEGTITYIMA